MRDEPDFGVLLAIAYATFVEQLREELADIGYADLPRSFGYVARALAERPMNLKALAIHLGVTSQGALKLVDELEEAGLVERIADPADGRAKQLRLTRRGRSALLAARAIHRKLEERLATDLGRNRVANVRAVLTEIVERGGITGVPARLRPV